MISQSDKAEAVKVELCGPGKETIYFFAFPGTVTFN